MPTLGVARERAGVGDRIGRPAHLPHRRRVTDARGAARGESVAPPDDSVRRMAREAAQDDLQLAYRRTVTTLGTLLPQARRLAISDEHLLGILMRDGPQTIARLARRMHLNAQTARYRISRLRKNGALQWQRHGGGAYVVSLTTNVAPGRRASSCPPSRGPCLPEEEEAAAAETRTVVVNGHLFEVVFSGRDSLTSGAAGLGSTLSGCGFPIRL
jgi:hypothetical protein